MNQSERRRPDPYAPTRRYREPKPGGKGIGDPTGVFQKLDDARTGSKDGINNDAIDYQARNSVLFPDSTGTRAPKIGTWDK